MHKRDLIVTKTVPKIVEKEKSKLVNNRFEPNLIL